MKMPFAKGKMLKIPPFSNKRCFSYTVDWQSQTSIFTSHTGWWKQEENAHKTYWQKHLSPSSFYFWRHPVGLVTSCRLMLLQGASEPPLFCPEMAKPTIFSKALWRSSTRHLLESEVSFSCINAHIFLVLSARSFLATVDMQRLNQINHHEHPGASI